MYKKLYRLILAISIFSYTAYAEEQSEESQLECNTEKIEKESIPPWMSPRIQALSIATVSSCTSTVVCCAMGIIKPKGVNPTMTGIALLASFLIGLGATYSYGKKHYMVIVARLTGSFFGIMFGLSFTNMVEKPRDK